MDSIPLFILSKLLSFPSESIKPIFGLLTQLPINQNKLSEILDWLREISLRDGVNAEDLLRSSLEEIGGTKDAFQRLEQLRDRLRKLRNPFYEKRKEQFENAIQGLKLPKNIQVAPSPFFEGDFLELKVRLSSEQELGALIGLLNREEWAQIFKDL